MNSLKTLAILIGIMTMVVILTACQAATPTPAPQEQKSTPTAAAKPTPTAPAPAAKANNIVIFDWAGFDDPAFSAEFKAQQPQIKVDYTLFEQDADAFAKMQTGFKVDLVHPCAGWWGLYVDAGLVQPIDTSKLKNWPDILPEMAKLGQFNGKQYFIPWDWTYESILVRTDKVTQKPTSWADLWNPAYAGHLAVLDTAEDMQIATAVALGFDPWHTTPQQDEAIKQKLIQLKPNILTYWVDATELSQLMASGDVWVAAEAWNETYGVLNKDGVPVEYIKPKEGRLGVVCGYGLSSQAQDVELAHAYLDALIAPKTMAFLGNEFWYGVSNKKAIDLIDPKIVQLLQLDRPEALKETVFFQTLTQEQRQKITKMWDEVKVSP